MLEYSPKNFPEVKLVFEYLPAEYDYGCGYQACPADITIHDLYINGQHVSSEIEDIIFEKFGAFWEMEILESQKEGIWT